MGGNVVQQHIDGLRAASDIKTRYQSERALTQMGEPAVIPLLDLLKTGNSDERSAAIRSLSIIGDQRAIQPMIDVLQNGDDEPSVRAWAVKYCSFFQDQRFVPILLVLFDDADVGKYVKGVLRGNPFLAEHAQTYLQQELDQATTEQQRHAIQSQLVDETSAEFDADQLYDPDQQLSAIQKLITTAAQRTLSKDFHQLITEQLMFIVDTSDDQALRKSAVTMLYYLDDNTPNREIKLKLLDLMQHEQDIEIRLEAMTAASRLARRSHPNIESNLLDALIAIIQSDEPERIRLQAIQAIKAFPRRQRVYEVLRPFVDTHASLSEAAKASLAATGYPIELENEQCVVCGLPQDRVQLYHCQICGKAICRADTWPREGGIKPPGTFCSHKCFRKSGLPSNPQYW